MHKGSIPTAKKPKKSLLCALNKTRNRPIGRFFVLVLCCCGFEPRMGANADFVKNGKERQKNSPGDCFDILPTEA